MADAIIYSSQDAGGPGLFSRSGIQSAFDILVPCLVSGYGAGSSAKPGQGWTVFHANLPTGFTLLSPDGVYYVFMSSPYSNSTSLGIQVYMAESLNTPMTYPPVGANVRSMNHSVDYSNDSDRHWAQFGNTATTAAHWAIAARGSQVLFSMYTNEPSSGSGDTIIRASSNGVSMFLGNLKLREEAAPKTGVQNSVFLGGVGEYADNYTSTVLRNGYNLSSAYTWLRNPIDGTVETGSLPEMLADPLHQALDNSSRFTPTEPLANDLVLRRVECWLKGAGSIGWIPGLFYAGRPSHYRTSYFLTLLEKAPSYSSIVEPLELAGELFYVLPTTFGQWLVSLDEQYW